ncbi:GNAT family N-acetyltransferase [Uliginosibacterium sp. H1]|uniref:GNAT family N-acetyltransferase n=1 Tax=Uliginosibacterium sp. H1 TaxID=3114757 RepID=UPI002E18DB02|nr:GNAT family N-acetyltransferase [Uliginosibacterium sp. H1]
MRESLERIGRFDPLRARARFLATFDPDFTRHIVCEGERVGFVVWRPQDGGLFLNHLYVLPAHQGRGIGAWVLRQMFAQADAEGLSVRVGALRGSDANRFYQRHGFVQTHEEDFDIYYARLPR